MTDTQRFVDAYYLDRGPCCAGCDHWRYYNSVAGECRKSAPVGGAERWAMLGLSHASGRTPDPGHIMTTRDHLCGDFIDTYDWKGRKPLPLPDR